MRTPALLVLALLALSSCSNSSSSSPPTLGSGTVGPGGGAVTAEGGTISLVVPAGALFGDVQISISESFLSNVPGYVDVGPTYLFSPEKTSFASPATVQVPFDPALLPSIVTDSDLVVGYRDETGRVSGLKPVFVDRTNGLARVETAALGAFWVVSPDIVSGTGLFPLGDGDSYRFDTGTILTVARTTTEPNFRPGEIAKLTITEPGSTTGFYFAVAGTSLRLLGEFDTASYQERLETAATLIGDRDPIGTVRPNVTTLLGYQPYGSSFVRYSGLTRVTSELFAREEVVTPLGVFEAVHVPIDFEYQAPRPGPAARLLELWFAEGIGPVMLRVESGPVQKLVEAEVDGQPVTGN